MLSTIHPADEAATKLKSAYPHYKPQVGIVLGSGLGDFVEQLTHAVSIPYQDIPGFPINTVQGHSGQMHIGKIASVDVICLQGRAHLYEGVPHHAVKNYVRTLQRMGCTHFIATNAAGSLCPDMHPGELALVYDHINFQGSNPLVGPNDDAFGPRFLPIDAIYDADIRHQFQTIAASHKLRLHEGIYIAVLGPNYESSAEIRAFRNWGADLVGMSTVPEVLVAHHCGMKVAVISTISNYATGIAKVAHDHNAVISVAKKAGEHLKILIADWIMNHLVPHQH